MIINTEQNPRITLNYKPTINFSKYKIAHQDLNSNNVLINLTGEIKLCDFRVSLIYEEVTTPPRNPKSSTGITKIQILDIHKVAHILLELHQEPKSPIKDTAMSMQRLLRAEYKQAMFSRYVNTEHFNAFINACMKQTDLPPDYEALQKTVFYKEHWEDHKHLNESISNVLDELKILDYFELGG